MEPVLSVQDLTKIYEGKTPFIAVDKISFHLKKGEILGLLGPNGSGKTTTIQMLLGTLSPSAGKICYFGMDLAKKRSEILQSVSFASTYTSLPYILTVSENLQFFGRLYGLNPKEIEKIIDPLLERFGILDKKKARISSLSAGQITRLMLVKAFFTKPKIVLLDEPTASLDPDVAKEVCEFLMENRDKTGLSILFTSHRMEEAMELCDRTIFLKKGKIIADDLPENLAKSVSLFQLSLTIADGMKRTIDLAEKSNFAYKLDHRIITITISEKQIPDFLKRLVQNEISYTNIHIDEPSLEDYFIQVAKKL